MWNRPSNPNFILFSHAAVAIVLSLTLSCGRTSSNQTTKDPAEARLEKAYALIDSDREDEAIELLRASLGESRTVGPREEEFRAALASAYVKRAGLPAQSFYSFARTWMETEGADDFKFVPDESPSSKGNEPKTALDLFEAYGLQSLAFFLQIKSRFDQLPDVTAEQDLELRKAGDVLQTIAEPSRGVALYRGLLQTVRFKYKLKRGLYFNADSRAADASERATDAVVVPVTCLHERRALLGGLENLASDVDSILGDLARAFPAQKAAMTSAQQSVRQARLELAKLKSEAITRSGLSAFEWEEVIRFVHRQFGWEWACL